MDVIKKKIQEAYEISSNIDDYLMERYINNSPIDPEEILNYASQNYSVLSLLYEIKKELKNIPAAEASAVE